MEIGIIYTVSQTSKPKYFSPQLQQTLIKVFQNWQAHLSTQDN